MVIIPIKEEFERLLLTTGPLVDQLEQRRYTFIDSIRDFAGSVEKLGEKYRLPFAVEAGIIRGRLCVVDEMSGVRQEYRQGGNYTGENRRAYRHNREAYALNKKLAHLEVLKKSICPCQDSNPTWSCSQSNHYTNYGTPAPKN